MSELNPNHPVTKMAHGQWHKLLAIYMHKLRVRHTLITLEDIEAFEKSGLGAVVLREKNNKLYLDLVTYEEGERLAREEGGLPN